MARQPTYNSSGYLRKCYAISGNHIRRICEILKNRTGTAPTVNMDLQGNTAITSDDIDSLLSDTILDVTKINTINFSSYAGRGSDVESIAVRLDGVRLSGPINISISGSRDAVNSARQDIVQLLEGTKQAYWALNSSNIFAALAYYVVAAAIGMIYALTIVYNLGTEFKSQYQIWIFVGFAVVVFGSVSIISDFRNYLFPKMEFLIGASGQSASWRRKIRVTTFSLVILAGAVSIFSSFIYDWLKSIISKS